MLTIEDMEIGVYLCDLFVKGYELITSSVKNEMAALEEAKNDQIKKSLQKNLYDDNAVNSIKKKYLVAECKAFVTAANSNPNTNDVLRTVKHKIIEDKKVYKIFSECGLCLNSDFGLDPKLFFANYKIAIKKQQELEHRITYEKQVRGTGSFGASSLFRK